jgi:hypothetical protein
MICQDSVSTDFDGENGRKLLQSVDQHGFAVRVITLCKSIETTEEGTADAPAETVIDSFLIFIDVLAARHCHKFAPFTIPNGELMESAKKKMQKNGCPEFLSFLPAADPYRGYANFELFATRLFEAISAK